MEISTKLSINVKIAEVCGWLWVTDQPVKNQSFMGSVSYADGWVNPKTGEVSDDYFDLPNYLNSLDAMHEAEKIIGAGDLGTLYIENFRRVCGCEHGDIWYIIHATAEQRAEAFLRTLNHK